MASYQDNKRGIISLTAGCALFTVTDTITKIVALSFPIGEVLFSRALACIAFVAAAFFFAYRTFSFHGAFQKLVLMRAVLDGIANATFVLALTKMRLADLMAINMMSPLVLTMLLAFFFKEKVGWRRWSAIFVGVGGMLLIVKPGPSTFDVWALIAFAATLFSATRDILTRRIDPATPTLVVTMVSLGGTGLAGLALALVLGERWTLYSSEYLGLIVVGAVFLAGGSTLAVSAFRNVDATVVAPFRYSLLIWSALSGYFVLGEVSDTMSIAGSLLIVGSGLYMLHRERVRHREVAARSAIR
ncbi:DMT family transporter [Undibacter mobilis]|uniref:DMT family transporter n=1 Tax=Undibacter mobilis TaxID=2292256 RepID=UPI00143CF169|nr:DMT family transporter [Undibacter mobilis]